MPALAVSAPVSRLCFDSPLGPLAVSALAAGVCDVEFLDDGDTRGTTTDDAAGQSLAARTVRELAEYFAGERTEFTVPLALDGTDFQRAVWAKLTKVPYGATCSYDDIARALGNPAAVRAVGQANGRNRVAVIVPCHRVINKGGGLGGYGGGLWRKRFLLDLEQRA
jgi:O-6-methylguanine DNA methyltransferase